MKRIAGFILLVVLTMSCSSVGKLSTQKEELVMTRKYVGNFVESRQTAPARLGDPNLIWIKTTMSNIFQGTVNGFIRPACGRLPV